MSLCLCVSVLLRSGYVSSPYQRFEPIDANIYLVCERVLLAQIDRPPQPPRAKALNGVTRCEAKEKKKIKEEVEEEEEEGTEQNKDQSM